LKRKYANKILFAFFIERNYANISGGFAERTPLVVFFFFFQAKKAIAFLVTDHWFLLTFK